MISALAITFNEVQNVEAYLERLSFADEIIIVDSFSSDGTKELAEKMGARVVQRKFDHFSNQRNFALSLAKHDWVVFFDLDERINDDLVLEIKEKVNSQAQLDGYYVKRQYFFLINALNTAAFKPTGPLGYLKNQLVLMMAISSMKKLKLLVNLVV